ncbi:MAG: hypothetical protein YK1309IOTA_890009 [Marine Group I thaumarchaeote]|nr:MAG: hypothetical protein YK1309IOTA_890009 [Marine Group I thaumarchaeote]
MSAGIAIATLKAHQRMMANTFVISVKWETINIDFILIFDNAKNKVLS